MMSKSKKLDVKKTLGRKRDPQLDTQIIDSALAILGEVGFDSMTMDMVAARTGAGKATLYRRWPSKAELVGDALISMSRNSVETETMPDTGSLRTDLLSVMKPYSTEFAERKMRVLSGLGSFHSEHQEFAREAMNGIFKPWIEINTTLMKRAQLRGEISAKADIETACRVIVAMTHFRTAVELKSMNRTIYAGLLDTIILPALAKSKNRH